jgi:hypothetical protein
MPDFPPPPICTGQTSGFGFCLAMTTLPTRLGTLVLALSAGTGIVSCTSDSAADGNIFLKDSPPRYGHGGTEAPKYKYGATESPTTGRGETQYLDGRKPRDTAQTEEPSRSDESSSGSENSGSSEEGEERTTTDAPPKTIDPEPSTETETPAPEPKPKPEVAEDIPYATPVPGQEGRVYSPFHNGGYVDVAGMPSGAKVRCPYTKKVFRVP